MMEFDAYREKVERKHNKALVELMKDLYVENDLGPSVSAKQLGMPRQAFMHFVHKYDLKKLKFGEYKKKMMIFQARQTAQWTKSIIPARSWTLGAGFCVGKWSLKVKDKKRREKKSLQVDAFLRAKRWASSVAVLPAGSHHLAFPRESPLSALS